MAPDTPDGGAGSLDGRTVLRISHAFAHGGGLEQYLDDLNEVLSARHRLHTVQIRLNHAEPVRVSRPAAASRLTTFYLPARTYTVAAGIRPRPWAGLVHAARNFLRDHVLYQPQVYRHLSGGRLRGRPAPRGLCDPDAMVRTLRAILAEFPVDCAVLHSPGDRDSQLALQVLAAAGIPAALVNHFSNDRFLNSALRQQVLAAQAVGAVGRSELPRYLQGRCAYVGDGIDLDFFQATRARPISGAHPGPRILLPARLVASKGHLDLIEAAARARRRGVVFHLYFAGRADSPGYVEALRARARARRVADQVHVIGALGREELRDWYAACAATALPTHHHEGLPRILLESQAMEVPVVAYDIGGVGEGLEPDRTGFLLRRGDTAGLAEALIRIVTGRADGPALGRAGRAQVKAQFSFPALAERHEALIGALVRPRPAPAVPAAARS